MGITHCYVQNLGNFELIFREFLVNIFGNPGVTLRRLHCTSGEANVDSAEFIYSRRDLKATRKCQYCHKLVVGNWNITLLTGKDHELVKEAKLLRPTVIFAACCWHVFDRHHHSNTVELDDY